MPGSWSWSIKSVRLFTALYALPIITGVLDTPTQVNTSQSHTIPRASPPSQPKELAWGSAATIQLTDKPAASIREFLLSQTIDVKEEKRGFSKEQATHKAPLMSAKERNQQQVQG
jgi:hypothetical protein